MGRRLVVVMPAYNAEATLERTWRDFPRAGVDEVILVDDASRDRTVEIARRLGLTVIGIPRTAATAATRRRATAPPRARGRRSWP